MLGLMVILVSGQLISGILSSLKISCRDRIKGGISGRT